jgi:hypothetical protein
LLEANRERINALFDQKLDLIKGAFQVRKIFLVRGVIVEKLFSVATVRKTWREWSSTLKQHNIG